MPVRAADLVCAFTSVLDDVPRALAELAAILKKGGHLIVSFFPLPVEARLPAGQDVVFALRKDAP